MSSNVQLGVNHFKMLGRIIDGIKSLGRRRSREEGPSLRTGQEIGAQQGAPIESAIVDHSRGAVMASLATGTIDEFSEWNRRFAQAYENFDIAFDKVGSEYGRLLRRQISSGVAPTEDDIQYLVEIYNDSGDSLQVLDGIVSEAIERFAPDLKSQFDSLLEERKAASRSIILSESWRDKSDGFSRIMSWKSRSFTVFKSKLTRRPRPGM